MEEKIKLIMPEIWRDVVGYEGLYEVSNWGRVKSLPRNGTVKYARILKPYVDKDGYHRQMLSKNGKHTNYPIHRLVAEAFIPNPHNYPCVNHKDENKLNNNVNNLEWCSAKYNSNYGTAIERRSKKRSKPILQFTLDGVFIKEWDSIAECGRNGFQTSAVIMCCKGKRKTHKGFIFKYK